VPVPSRADATVPDARPDALPVATVSGKYLRFDFGSGNSTVVDGNKFYQSHGSTSGDHGTWKWQGSDDASDWTDITSSFNFAGGVGETVFTTLSANTTAYRYYQLLGISGSTGSSYWREMIFKSAAESSTASATGTLISDTQTSSVATTKMSGVILYKDNEGTATLGTDLVISYCQVKCQFESGTGGQEIGDPCDYSQQV